MYDPDDILFSAITDNEIAQVFIIFQVLGTPHPDQHPDFIYLSSKYPRWPSRRVYNSKIPVPLLEILNECWTYNPKLRPSAATVLQKLRHLC